MKSPAIIIGGGLAGLCVALAMAPAPVVVLARREERTASTSSSLAQGGLAAAMGDDDTPALHAADTLAAGAGLCDATTVGIVTQEAAAAVARLESWGVKFDREADGRLALGLEGAHSRRRIVHAGGDSTGAFIIKALVGRAKGCPSITLIKDADATDIAAQDGAVRKVEFIHAGQKRSIAAENVILCTGGAGALWEDTTNPSTSWGSGLALAARAGATLRDLEFMQFHPTALAADSDPLPLVSEAVRGEGAVLLNSRGERFMANVKGAELAARDIVARAIWEEMKSGAVFLDARGIPAFSSRFPSVTAACLAAGVDPASQPIPVRPAAHYHMGGVEVDEWGRSAVRGLWACGEAAATGLHGANRLASNSLLEAAVFGIRIGEKISRSDFGEWRKTSANRASLPEPENSKENRQLIRDTMSQNVGLVRDASGLRQAVDALRPMAAASDMALAAFMIASMALRREESRGAHLRGDFIETNETAASSFMALDGYGGITVPEQGNIA